MNQAIIDLYDEYTHRPLPRRVFLERLALLAGGAAAATALLPILENNYARAAIVPADDARLEATRLAYRGATGEVRSYLAKPRGGAARLPAVVVIHENRGLNPYTEDVARRLAVAGYLALAPDFLSQVGGTPASEDAAREAHGKIDRAAAIRDAVAAVGYLKSRPDATGKLGCIGFCWGGGIANEVAVNAPDLAAAVPFYGPQPKAEDVPKIKARLLLHYAGIDERINAGIPAYENALKAAGVRYTLYMYPNVNHAFHNDTGAARYDKAAAELAWSRTVAFLGDSLKD
jgi:carboxymethylenebutenolidase